MNKRHLFLYTLIIWLILTFSPAQAEQTDRFLVPSRYFGETGHNVGGLFLEFYDQYQGAIVFGLPITEVLDEQGVQTQYFEYARLEIRPEHPDQVVIAPLGELLSKGQHHEPAFTHHEPGPAEISTYFPSTGHNLSHQFHHFWHNYGGHRIFGLPISEAFLTYNETEHRSYTIQYFERARLEYRLEHPGAPPIIRAGSLGRDYIATYEQHADLLQSAREIAVLGNSHVHFAPLPGDMQNISLAARQFASLKVTPGEQVSYLETVGVLSSETGYVPGSGIVNGTEGQVIAGGICYLSTALFRAVVQAGLDILERHPHTVLLPDLGDAPGLDSAVFTADGKGLNRNGLYDLDLRWRNDMDEPIIITTDVITTGDLFVSLWGYSDGRITTLSEPIVEYSSQPGVLWRYDSRLPACGVQKVVAGSPGMRTVIKREVRDSSGAIIHDDRLVSHYTPFKDVVLYGPGITPIQDGSVEPAQTARENCEATWQKEQ